MDWLTKIPVKMTEDGRLRLSPKNDEPKKSVIDVAPKLEKAIDYEIANGFPGVLT